MPYPKFTHEEHLKSRKDGWKLVNGLPAPIYTENGVKSFITLTALWRFLYSKADNDEWYRDLILSLPWTVSEAVLGISEGWVITEKGDLGLSSKVPSSKSKQISERELEVFFKTRVNAGDLLYIKAMRVIATRRLTWQPSE